MSTVTSLSASYPVSVHGVHGSSFALANMEREHAKISHHSQSPEGGALTALMLACQQAREEEVRTLIKKKPQIIMERDRSGKSALHYCAENQHLNCADQLVSFEPSLLNLQDEEGYTTLHLAVISGNTLIVKYLIAKGADVNLTDSERHSLVHWATVCGETEALEHLMEAGANPSMPDVHGAFPIHYAAQMCGPGSELGTEPRIGLITLKKLLQRGVPVAVVDQDGRSPLLWAASAGSADAILALTNAGASVEAEDKDGLTALHCAASRGHVDCLETLVSLCGAEVDVMDANGCTALFYAVTLGHADCTHTLLKFGAEPNRQDRKGRTPSHCGAAKGQLETLKILAKHQANLWLRNVRGDLPLHEAVQSGRKDLVTWLLAQRPESVNAPNSDGRCPLHIAAINNNVEMCKVLLDNKAHVNPIMRNSRGHFLTPLDAALHRGNRGCAKYLQLHGGVPAARISDKNALQRALMHALSESEALATAFRPTPSPIEEGVQTDDGGWSRGADGPNGSRRHRRRDREGRAKDGKWEDESEEGEEGYIRDGGVNSSNSVRGEPLPPYAGRGSSISPRGPHRSPGLNRSDHERDDGPSISSSSGGKDSGFGDTMPLSGERKRALEESKLVDQSGRKRLTEENESDLSASHEGRNGRKNEHGKKKTMTGVENKYETNKTKKKNGRLAKQAGANEDPGAVGELGDGEKSSLNKKHKKAATKSGATGEAVDANGEVDGEEENPDEEEDSTEEEEDDEEDDDDDEDSNWSGDGEDRGLDEVSGPGAGGGRVRGGRMVGGIEKKRGSKKEKENGGKGGLRRKTSASSNSGRARGNAAGRRTSLSSNSGRSRVNGGAIARKASNSSNSGRPRLKTPSKSRILERNGVSKKGRKVSQEKESVDPKDPKGRKMPSISNATATAPGASRGASRYELERRIFSELLELKRLQIRSGPINEKLLVKRLVDAYKKEGLHGLKTYDGPYTFSHFEKYLYESLKSIQTSPLFKAIKENEEKHGGGGGVRDGVKSDQGIDYEPGENGTMPYKTNCHHAAHAYTGIPCVAYIKPNHHHFLKSNNGQPVKFLPKIQGQPPPIALKDYDPRQPLTLQLNHGGQKQLIEFPETALDKNKRYHVTFTIKPSTPNTMAGETVPPVASSSPKNGASSSPKSGSTPPPQKNGVVPAPKHAPVSSPKNVAAQPAKNGAVENKKKITSGSTA